MQNGATETKPYGHSAVVVHYREGELVETRIHRKGRRAVIERAARLMTRFVRIEAISAFTEEEWIRCYGEGSEHGTPLRLR